MSTSTQSPVPSRGNPAPSRAITRAAGGITRRDLEMARRISNLG